MPTPKNRSAANGDRDTDVRTLAKGLAILSLFRPDRHTMTVDEIAKELEFPVSSTYRLVATLKDRGYLRKVRGHDGYTLDTRLLRFGEVVRASSRLYELSQPYMEELVQLTRESASLAVRTGDRATVVASVDSPEMIKFMPNVGWSFPLHAGAAGKVFLAYSSPTDLKRYLQHNLEAVTDRTITDPVVLRTELQLVRDRGYAVIEEELMLGGLSAAAPVFDHDDKIAACLSIAGPVSRLTRERATELAPALCDCANRMSIELGAPAKTRSARSGSRPRGSRTRAKAPSR